MLDCAVVYVGGGDDSATICRDQMLSAGCRVNCRIDCGLTRGGKMMRRGARDPRADMRCAFACRDGARNGLHGRGSRESSLRARQPFEKLRNKCGDRPRVLRGWKCPLEEACRLVYRLQGFAFHRGVVGICFHPTCQNRKRTRSGLGLVLFHVPTLGRLPGCLHANTS